ncbi:HSPB1-associated protein 1 homolog [Aplochiton taeniatus]
MDKPKPFGTAEAQKILSSLQRPAVFLNMACDWPVLQWSATHLSYCLGGKAIRFRLGKRKAINTPLYETHCSYVEATLVQFTCWAGGLNSAGVGPFCDYPYSEYWAYADYKYIAMLFHDQPSMFEDVKWSDFGFPGRNGRESTLWIGTEGANTPCHLDSYGCNLVLQVEGRKRWHLFPPEDTSCLYPTRIPYEESSVFSQVDVLQPDLHRFCAFKQARVHMVTLEPGQVLYVPRHWWHYVESVDPVTISVNSWIELATDDEARVGEALTKAVVCALKTAPSADNTDAWLNPTEERVSSHEENLQYLSLAVGACMDRERTPQRGSRQPQDTEGGHGVRRDHHGEVKRRRWSGSCTVPFGPHLVPVPCTQDLPQPAKDTKEGEVQSSKGSKSPTTDSFNGPVHSRTLSHHGACERSPDRRGGSVCGDRGDGNNQEDKDDTVADGHPPITTNDLLECLVHPDVVARVTELLLARQRQGQSLTKAL